MPDVHDACLNIATVTPTMHTMYDYSEYMYIRGFCFLEIPQNYNPVLIPSLVMAVEPDSRFGTTIVGYSHSLLPPPPVFRGGFDFSTLSDCHAVIDEEIDVHPWYDRGGGGITNQNQKIVISRNEVPP
jgi:hypothetical protein